MGKDVLVCVEYPSKGFTVRVERPYVGRLIRGVDEVLPPILRVCHFRPVHLSAFRSKVSFQNKYTVPHRLGFVKSVPEVYEVLSEKLKPLLHLFPIIRPA